jgi:uncharacterized repeat protein (TIGR01451 family)
MPVRRHVWVSLAALVLFASSSAAQVLSINKVASESPISAGDIATFRIVVQNTGVANALNVTLSDPLPGGLAWTDDSDQCTISAATLSCSFGTFSPAEAVVVTVSATTTVASCGTLSSTATVSSTNAQTKQDSAEIVVDCPSLLTIVGQDQVVVRPDARFGFTACVSNVGAGVARNVRIELQLPSLVWTLEPFQPACALVGDPEIVCTFGDMAFGVGRCAHLSSSTAGCAALEIHTAIKADNASVGSSFVVVEPKVAGDQDASCGILITDVFRLINFLFAGGPGPL